MAMIPKIFHRIWLGGKPMPDQFIRFGKMWEEMHPDWNMQTWTEMNLPVLANQDQFDQSQWLAQKADIARYELIWRYGGVYLDTDFEPIKRIDPLLEGVTAFSARENEHTIAIGIFGAVPHHPAITEIIYELPRRFNPGQSPNETTGPSLMTSIFKDRSDVKVFGPDIFYPIPFGATTGDMSKAYAVHHWAHSWK